MNYCYVLGFDEYLDPRTSQVSLFIVCNSMYFSIQGDFTVSVISEAISC